MQKMMYAANLHAPNDLRYEQVPVPELGAEDVLVKVSACGVCEIGRASCRERV